VGCVGIGLCAIGGLVLLAMTVALVDLLRHGSYDANR
jgi:hypothetical protein